jgi:hypothetical protein
VFLKALFRFNLSGIASLSAAVFIVAETLVVAQAPTGGRSDAAIRSAVAANGVTTDLFLPATTFASGGINLSGVAVADVNGDGRPDAITANPTGGIGVSLGNGDGTFQTAVMYAPGASSVAVADLNGDGKPDLVVNVWFQSNVGVLLGNGDGTFQPTVIYFSGRFFAIAVTIADVNNDGKADLLVADCGQSGCAPNEAGSVGVLLGNGDGTFQPVITYAGGQPISIAVADVNADGKPDMVVANWALGTVGVFIGNGDGSFQSIQTYDAGASVPSSVVVADLNGDGKADIAVASFVDANNPGVPVGVLLGNGDGTFQPVVTYSSGGQERTALTVADVNGDAIPDLLVTSGCLLGDLSCAEGNIGVLAGNGDGTFQPAVLFGSGARFPVSITAVDVNGDGRRDIVVANYGSGNEPGVVGVLLNNNGDHESPLVTVSSSPTTLWPPAGEIVPVVVFGTISESGSGIKPGSPHYTVIDEYGKVQPDGSVTLLPDGRYSVVVFLQASREGSDRDGRRYTITVSATDNAGNIGSNQTLVIVPHDLRR